ncbi:trypsin-4-like [Episyrphus balteatus]|uniref:trypsin-4-like n=1 Tax=Episyrphus balteatus TaxID=286459 RepID=UPI002485E49C|nr:trypsin-4-like [Episyrphus balteatus]
MKAFSVIVFLVIVAFVNCSNIPINGKIVGGQEVDITQYPYAVSVRNSNGHICGGSIIAANKILTAAHCTEGQDSASMTIRCGSSIADQGTSHKVIKIAQHPNFTDEYNHNDVSVLTIRPKITFNSRSQPAKLAEKRAPDGSDVEICGWGVHYYGAPTAGVGQQKMRAVKLQVVNQEICNKDYNTTEISDKLMCAAARGKDSCQGDSGGALINSINRRIVGISSFGDECAKPGKPGVYTSVPNVLKFIRAQL